MARRLKAALADFPCNGAKPLTPDAAGRGEQSSSPVAWPGRCFHESGDGLLVGPAQRTRRRIIDANAKACELDAEYGRAEPMQLAHAPALLKHEQEWQDWLAPRAADHELPRQRTASFLPARATEGVGSP